VLALLALVAVLTPPGVRALVRAAAALRPPSTFALVTEHPG
jgi:hypothetical protein